MKRTVFLVEKICLAEEYASTSKVATTYIGAINIFKTFIVDTLVFNAIWDMHIDNEVPTGENLLLYGGGKDSTYRMFTRCGKPIYEFPLEEYFLKNDYDQSEDENAPMMTTCGGEITLKVGSYIFLLRAVEEES